MERIDVTTHDVETAIEARAQYEREIGDVIRGVARSLGIDDSAMTTHPAYWLERIRCRFEAQTAELARLRLLVDVQMHDPTTADCATDIDEALAWLDQADAVALDHRAQRARGAIAEAVRELRRLQDDSAPPAEILDTAVMYDAAMASAHAAWLAAHETGGDR